MKTIITILIIFIYTQALSGTLVEDFSSKPENRWQFFTDQVMGGVSSGNLEFIHSNDISYARMFGNVSTANNGGFIQFRSTLGTPLNENIKGIKLKVRGNNQQYFVHLRTTGSLLPWQYYSSGFDASDKWNEIKVLVETIDLDVHKNANGNASAGVRARKGLRVLKSAASDLVKSTISAEKDRKTP